MVNRKLDLHRQLSSDCENHCVTRTIIVFTDNFYMSLVLATSLLGHGTHLVGTFQVKRTGVLVALRGVRDYEKTANEETCGMSV